MKRGFSLIALVSIAGAARLWLLLMRFDPPADQRIDPGASAPAAASAAGAPLDASLPQRVSSKRSPARIDRYAWP